MADSQVMSRRDDAHASGSSAPGRGEIRPVSLPEPGPTTWSVRTLRSVVDPGTETMVAGAVPWDQSPDARPVSGG